MFISPYEKAFHKHQNIWSDKVMVVFAIVWCFGHALGLTNQVSPHSNINISMPCVAPKGDYPFRDFIFLYTQADVDAIAECSVFAGVIKVMASFPGDFVLPNLEELYGGLLTDLYPGPADNRSMIISSNLTGLIAPRLRAINATTLETISPTVDTANATRIPRVLSIEVFDVTSLNTIWVPNLYNIDTHISIDNLPALSNLSNIYLPQNTSTRQLRITVKYTNISSFMLSDSSRLVDFDINISGNKNLDDLTLSIYNASTIFISGRRITFNSTNNNNTMIIVRRRTIFSFPITRFWKRVTYMTLGATIVRERLEISGCEQLDLRGLGSVMGRVEHGGGLFLHNTNLTQVEIIIPGTGTLSLLNNAYLRDVTFKWSVPYLDGYPDKSGIEGHVIISNCPMLTNISLSNPGIMSQFKTIKLLSVSGSVNISNCSTLSNLSFENLETIGGDINIIHNPQLRDISGFPRLQTISGTANFQGNLATVRLPLLEHAFNGFTLNSTTSSLDCSELDRFHEQKLIRGAYKCMHLSEPISTVETTKSLPNPPSHYALSTGAKIGIGIAVAIGGIGSVLGIGLYSRSRQRKHSKVRLAVNGQPKELPLGGYHETTELPQGKHHERTELPESECYLVKELPLGRHHEQTEVPANSKPTELHGEPIVRQPQPFISRKPVPRVAYNTKQESEGRDL